DAWRSLLQRARPEDAPTARLNDHRALFRREKMRHVRGNDDEAAGGIGLELRLVELCAKPQVPRAFDDRDDLLVRMRVREDPRAARDFHSIDPVSAIARIAEKVRALPAVGLIVGGEPLNVLRRQRRDWLL